jgi:hypothetical protein
MVSGKVEGRDSRSLERPPAQPGFRRGNSALRRLRAFPCPAPRQAERAHGAGDDPSLDLSIPRYAHHRAATQAGLSEAVISAIAEGNRPAGLAPDEQAVYNFSTELLRITQMSDATFNAAEMHLGERGVVEIMGVIGYYQTVQYPLPDGVAPELKPLR